MSNIYLSDGYREKLENNIRFDDPVYPEFLRACDDAYSHTVRTIKLANNIFDSIRTEEVSDYFFEVGVQEEFRSDCLNMLAVHDIPESLTSNGDIAVFSDRYGSDIDEELKVAQQMESVHAQAFFIAFLEAENFLERGSFDFDNPPPAPALVAKTIDLIEGNYTYFRKIKDYLDQTPQISQDELMDVEAAIVKGWEYMEKRRTNYMIQMLRLQDFAEYEFSRVLITLIFEEQEKHVTELFQSKIFL